MPLGLSTTIKANLLAGKYAFSYSPLVLLWPPLSHFKGKREFFLASPWLQHLFEISYDMPNIGKKALHQGNRHVLLSHNRHLQLALRSLASLGQLWPGTVILKLTLRDTTDSNDRATASAASGASACRFRSFCRFCVSFLLSLISYLV